MAEQIVTLNPGESKVVGFVFTPAEARAYQVSVDGLSGSFIAVAAPTTRLYGYLTDADIGIPVVGASITIYQDYDTKTKSWDVFTDQYGFYEAVGMIPGVSAEMVVYAGGYQTFTRTGIPIAEGDNELNIVLTWKGGPRDVPLFKDYSLPSQIVNGKEFPGSVTVWFPPADSVKYTVYLRLKGVLVFGLTYNALNWRLVNASIYDESERRREEYGLESYMEANGYLRIADEGGTYTLTGISPAKTFPLGVCDVEVRIGRNHTSVAKKGTLTGYSSEHPEYWWWEAIVGTIKVV